MHKKISVGLSVTISILLIMVTIIVTTAVTMNIYSDIVSDIPEREEMYDSLAQLDTLVRNNYYGTAEEESVNSGIAEGYLSSLDGVNKLLSADEYSLYKARISGLNEDGTAKQSVSHSVFSNSGYIKISDFTDNTVSEFKSAYESLKNSSVTSLIIDVRNTDSINIKAAAEIIDLIVPLATEGSESIATAVDRDNNNIEIFSADSDSISLPVSVIVNENTSGAGELIACDIRDFGKGTVVGKTTAGNGTYQKVFEMSDGSAVILTVAKLIPYTSDCYDGIGVTPDYVCELTKETDTLSEDSQFLQAYASVTALQK